MPQNEVPIPRRDLDILEAYRRRTAESVRSFAASFDETLECLAGGDSRLLDLIGQSIGRAVEKEISRTEDHYGYYLDLFKYPLARWEHICDWLRASLANRSPWLFNLDSDGIPKKLAKIGSLAALEREIEKQMARTNMRLGSGTRLPEGEEKVEMAFDDGWTIVRLLTPAALDTESVAMQHCVGHGGYDERLLRGEYRYLSLRDPANKPHVTFELKPDGDSGTLFMVQMQGKQNSRPLRKYTVRVVEYLERNSVSAQGYGLISDIHGKVHFLDSLPETLELDRDITFRRVNVGPDFRMPRVVRARNIIFLGPFDQMPQEVVANGNLSLEGDQHLPTSFRLKGTLTIINNRVVKALPENLEVENLSLVRTPTLSLPRGLVVNGKLSLVGSQMAITRLPVDARFRAIDISGLSIEDFDTDGFLPERQGIDAGRVLVAKGSALRRINGERRFFWLDIGGTRIDHLPEDLAVSDVLDITGTDIAHIPAGAVPKVMLIAGKCRRLVLPQELDCEMVDLTEASVRLPENMKCVGDLILRGATFIALSTAGQASYGGLDSTSACALPKTIQAASLDIRDTRLRRLPSGLNVDSIVASEGEMVIEPGASFHSLRVQSVGDSYQAIRELTYAEAFAESDRTGMIMTSPPKSSGRGTPADQITLLLNDCLSHYDETETYAELLKRRMARGCSEDAINVGRSVSLTPMEYALAC
jgi:hypothetical protein